MAKSIREMLRTSAELARDAEAAKAELSTKLSSCSKKIGDVQCSFMSIGNSLRVRMDLGGSPDGHVEIPADTFSLICGWFGKHYIGGVMDENGKPETEKEV